MSSHDRIFSILFISIAVFVFGFTLYQTLIISKTKDTKEQAQQKAQIQAPLPTPAEKEAVPSAEETVSSPSSEEAATSSEATLVLLLEEGEISETKTVKIKDTPTGWLNVRDGPGISYAYIKRVNPGEIYEVLDEKFGWYQIQFDKELTGWITSRYADKK